MTVVVVFAGVVALFVFWCYGVYRFANGSASGLCIAISPIVALILSLLWHAAAWVAR